jgi:ADP-ribosylglycohydrolase
MIGAIAGDIIGSVFEWCPTKRTDFSLFHLLSAYTDDTVLTMAVAEAILKDGDYGRAIKSFARHHPGRGYGGRFMMWMLSPSTEPYNSFGNGSAMRVSPVGFAFDTEDNVLEEAKRSADVTHNHPEGVKGAQATALAIFMARKGRSKADIKREISGRFGYDLDRTLAEIRPAYKFDVTCQGSVPEAIIAFLESDSFEDAIRKAISLGGDADTQACITGGIAEAFYHDVPPEITESVRKRLPDDFLDILDRFRSKFQL